MKDQYSVTVLGNDLHRDGKSGICCNVFVLVLLGIYGTASLACSLVARLYYRTFYLTANASALAFFIAVFVWIHHLGALRKTLAINRRCFEILQFILNLIFLLSCLCMGACFTVLFVIRTSVLNIDVLGCMAWSWVNAVIFIYLMISTHCSRNIAIQTKGDPSINDLNRKSNYVTNIPIDENISTRGGCAKCVIFLLRLIFWLFYIAAQIIFIIFFLGSAYHAASSLYDVTDYRRIDKLHNVDVFNHRTLGVFMKCKGSAQNGTIVYEHGLGDSVILSWIFVPEILSRSYRVCAFSRRGYDWSEGYEQDNPGLLIDEPQSAENNVDFTKALVDAANISIPFYHMGYSYGGHHVVYEAIKYPSYVKALILLDSSQFGVFSMGKEYLELAANFNPTGLLRFAVMVGIFDPKQEFDQFPWADIPDTYYKEFLAASFTNNYFASYLREKKYLESSGQARIKDSLKGVTIDKPVLVIDAGDRDLWFPYGQFPQYRGSTHYNVAGSNHQTITHNIEFAEEIGLYVDDFISNLG